MGYLKQFGSIKEFNQREPDVDGNVTEQNTYRYACTIIEQILDSGVLGDKTEYDYMIEINGQANPNNIPVEGCPGSGMSIIVTQKGRYINIIDPAS